MEHIFVTSAAEETMDLGQKFVALAKPGSVFCLTGDLGAGKTTLVRGIARALHITSVVQSPTFNIMKVYFNGDRPLIHIDAYRLADVNTDIGLDEYIGYETGLTVIEWPEFIKELIPDTAIEVCITNLGRDKRNIKVMTSDKGFLEGLKKWLQFF